VEIQAIKLGGIGRGGVRWTLWYLSGGLRGFAAFAGAYCDQLKRGVCASGEAGVRLANHAHK